MLLNLYPMHSLSCTQHPTLQFCYFFKRMIIMRWPANIVASAELSSPMTGWHFTWQQAASHGHQKYVVTAKLEQVCMYVQFLHLNDNGSISALLRHQQQVPRSGNIVLASLLWLFQMSGLHEDINIRYEVRKHDSQCVLL